MKFIVSSTALSSHLQAISRVINSKNALPILDCFLFELEDGTLSVTVSDSETTMVTTVEVNESDTNGRFAVVAKTLLDALKEIPEQPLTFDINPENYEKVGTNKTYISRIEKGIIEPGVGLFFRIIDALGLKIEIVKPIM
jgi:DNA polymerase III sliding clamp (beta) subunit (PCNA family)